MEKERNKKTLILMLTPRFSLIIYVKKLRSYDRLKMSAFFMQHECRLQIGRKRCQNFVCLDFL